MIISIMLRLTKDVRSKIKRCPALKNLRGTHFKLALFAAALFALAFAAETRAIIALESSQDLFEAVPNQLLYR